MGKTTNIPGIGEEPISRNESYPLKRYDRRKCYYIGVSTGRGAYELLKFVLVDNGGVNPMSRRIGASSYGGYIVKRRSNGISPL